MDALRVMRRPHRTRRTSTRRVSRSWSSVVAVLVSSVLLTSPLTAHAMPAALDKRAAGTNAEQQLFAATPAQPSTTFDQHAAPTQSHSTYLPSDTDPAHATEYVDDLLSRSQHHLQKRIAEGVAVPSIPLDSSAPQVVRMAARGPSLVRRYSLPSSYPSSIASSWSRPERSVWFQSKAIIITSCFLAIFIILFIGAAVFLRERKLDDELADMGDDEALARLDERMTGNGRGGGDSEKDQGSKRRFRLSRKKNDKEMKHVDSQPSSGSSSGVKRRRHIVSRWTKRTTRDSRETLHHPSDDTASIRSAHSTRRAALGDPTETVQITYHDGDELQTSQTSADTSDSVQPLSASTGSEEASSSAQQGRRAALDDSDFQAADFAEHDDARHMPPAYIPSNVAGSSAAPAHPSLVADAMARGDSKHGIPPPAERDASVSADIVEAAMANDVQLNQQDEQVGTASAHLATDDKVVLGALTAAASMPSAPEASAPAYGSARNAEHVQDGQGPSAPTVEVDDDGFERTSDAAAAADDEKSRSKGKAKQGASALPAPPQAIEPAFSRFDQPYRAQTPYTTTPAASSVHHNTTHIPSSNEATTARHLEKQREADDELAQLVASQPTALDVPRYERHNSFNSASAPPLLPHEESEEAVSSIAPLPAYERNHLPSANATPSASAPPLEDD